jgi:hypothetical protein
MELDLSYRKQIQNNITASPIFFSFVFCVGQKKNTRSGGRVLSLYWRYMKRGSV